MNIGAIGAAVVALSVASSSVTAEPFRIAHNQRLPPLAEVKDGQSVGLAIDLVRAAAARAGIDVTFVPVTIEQQMPALKNGSADALLGADTPERRQVLRYSSTVVMTGGSLYVRAPSPTPESLAALSGKTVVTPRAGPLADFIRRTAPAVNLVVTEDYDDSLARVVAGTADAAALNASAGARIAEANFPGQFTMPKIMFFEQPFAVGSPNGQADDMVARLDAGLAAIRADGTWQQISDRWAGR